MHRPLSISVVSCALSIALCAGCGGSSVEAAHGGEAAEAAPPLDPVELLPADAFAVARVDVQKLRASPYWPTVEGWIGQLREAAVEAGESGGTADLLGEVLDRTSLLVVGMAPGRDGGEPELLIVADGQLRPGDLALLLGQRAERAGAQVRITEQGGRTRVDAEEVSGLEASPGRWLVATGGRLDDMVARLEGRGGGTPLASDRFRAMAEQMRFDTSTVAVVVEATPQVRQQLAARVRRPEEQALARSLQVFGARLDLVDGIDLVAVAETDDPRVSEAVVAYVQRNVDAAGNNPVVRLMGLRGLLDAIAARAEGPEARLAVRADDATTRTALDRLGGFIGLALRAMVAGGEYTPGPQPPAMFAEEEPAP